MDLTVRSAFTKESEVEDVVRIHNSHRHGIKSGEVCKLTAITNEGDGALSRYVQVKGIGGYSDLLSEYLTRHPMERNNDFDYYADSVFMNAKTRQKFFVTVGNRYQFEIGSAGVFGSCRYFITYPDRHLKFLAWATVVGLMLGLLGVLGYTLKDWIAGHFP